MHIISFFCEIDDFFHSNDNSQSRKVWSYLPHSGCLKKVFGTFSSVFFREADKNKRYLKACDAWFQRLIVRQVQVFLIWKSSKL